MGGRRQWSIRSGGPDHLGAIYLFLCRMPIPLPEEIDSPGRGCQKSAIIAGIVYVEVSVRRLDQLPRRWRLELKSQAQCSADLGLMIRAKSSPSKLTASDMRLSSVAK